MKYDYDSMSNNELHELYYRVFGVFFAMNWDDDDPHRDEVIACIESGTPQDEEAFWASIPDLPEGVIA